MTNTPAAPRPAASLVLLRDGSAGPEVLLLRRALNSRFMPGAYVFPGGAVDAGDATPEIFSSCSQLDDAAASKRLNVERGGLAFFVAAIRECFEESGVLFAQDEHGRSVHSAPGSAAGLHEARLAMIEGRLRFGEFCAARGLQLEVAALGYWSHWITPRQLPLRFDTRFFVARVPDFAIPALASAELDELLWLPPAQAVAMSREGRLQLRFPTRTTLQELANFAQIDDALAFAHSPRTVRPTEPELDQQGQPLVPSPASPGAN